MSHTKLTVYKTPQTIKLKKNSIDLSFKNNLVEV